MKNIYKQDKMLDNVKWHFRQTWISFFVAFFFFNQAQNNAKMFYKNVEINLQIVIDLNDSRCSFGSCSSLLFFAFIHCVRFGVHGFHKLYEQLCIFHVEYARPGAPRRMIGNWSETFASRFEGFSIISVVYLTAASSLIFVHMPYAEYI